ncbi:hypothetical protein FA13DRAFT_1786268 [Coprinellus micaceus]|uniref:F-box domain-containing protein n=1 Tax=Coprinellus micaceus TaxID=71717 RepID=A0A4Y7TX19_COPMI|nr:hypothetical protein FA13DRAFT_1786268 [Coprinellus micaceus]
MPLRPRTAIVLGPSTVTSTRAFEYIPPTSSLRKPFKVKTLWPAALGQEWAERRSRLLRGHKARTAHPLFNQEWYSYRLFSKVGLPVQPLPHAPLLELPSEIWLEIFQFATHVPRSTSLRPSDPFKARRVPSWNIVLAQNTPGGVLYTKVALSCVSKSWRTLAVPLQYQHVVIKSPMRARLILRSLTESQNGDCTGHGKWTWHIEVLTHTRGSGSLPYLQSVFGIFRCCPNVRVLSGTWNHPLPPPFLDAITKLYGSGMEELYWNEIAVQVVKRAVNTLTTVATLHFLGAFSSLQTLDLRHFKAKGCSTTASMDAPTTIPLLPLVQHLIISTNPWSVTAASGIVLPRLLSLTVKITRGFIQPAEDGSSETHLLDRLIKAHGLSLESGRPFLDEDACPNLSSICYPVCPEFLPLLGKEHSMLRRIGLRDVKADLLAITRDKPDHVANDHLQALYRNVARYPGVQLVQTIGFCVGKSTTKDVFIWWTERFARKGVLLLDGEGVFWEFEEPAGMPKPALGQGPATLRNGFLSKGDAGVVCWKIID